MADSIEDYFEQNFHMINDLATEMNFVQQESKSEVTENPFMGKSVAVTGKLIHFTRDSINAKLESLGAKPASGVSAKTDYLINNDPTSGSSKNKKANELNIPIITEEQFLEMIGENNDVY
jgi:DNA ligase (NAD+)